MKRRPFLMVSLWMVAALVAGAALAQVCTCDNTTDSICVSGPSGNGFQGFAVELVSFDIDQNAGTSEWIYEICDKGPLDPDCPSDKALSHIDVVLGDLSACLNPTAQITFEKHADSAGDGADLICVVEDGDPSCPADEGLVAKCDVGGNALLPGDCVQMKLSIAGETVDLGAGAIQVQSKAGPGCALNCLLGPSCEPCDGGPPPSDECLTRTPGFWGTHPHITDRFLPVTACGEDLTTVDAGSCDSATEAMCVSPGRESKKNRAYAQLVRQLTAAKLNLAATAANGGFCGGAIDTRIAECEALYCNAKQKEISGSGCIEDLAAFNESLDTFAVTPPPFDRPGPADPTDCRQANGNGVLIGGSCVAAAPTVASLESRLFGGDPDLWPGAIDGLAEIGDRAAFKVLKKAGRRHPDRATRRDARREAKQLRKLL